MGWRGTRLFLAVCSFAFLAASQANAANRIALVIGNNAYENVPQLQKAVNDADAIAAELSKAKLGQQAKSDLVQPA